MTGGRRNKLAIDTESNGIKTFIFPKIETGNPKLCILKQASA